MTIVLAIAVVLAGAIALAYRRANLRSSALVFAGALVLAILAEAHWALATLLGACAAMLGLLAIRPFRLDYITPHLLQFYRSRLPSVSATEREALAAGTVGWEGELFSGRPDWARLLDTAGPQLSEEERAFLDGPTEELCSMLDEWRITHELGDLPPEVWDFLKRERFFAMIIPKRYGGLEFSAAAHSAVLVKVAGLSVTAASTIGVPNSLGPAELLLRYGTEAQKDHYLPRLARGEEIPCFALTGPRSGSDATSLPDTGIVCRGAYEGREVLGIRLNWDKRYITLAPVATVLGLAFKLYDPDHLIGDREDYGITCALVPAHLPGITIGRRHYPIGAVFQNGPTQGKDVFVPLDAIIGGVASAGRGWHMLVECLAVGRAITLPSNSVGGALRAVAASGAYTRIRRQFNQPIGRLEGVQEALARMAGLTYAMDSARRMTAAAVDRGERPAVPSAIAKYHVTEMARQVSLDAMDVQGGKAVCMGPSNYLALGYQTLPIAITVEGANILTRSLIIFGQGAIRCHPWLLREMQAAARGDDSALADFDEAVFGHVGHTLSVAARALVLGLTGARSAPTPRRGAVARYYQQIARFSAALALVADAAMLSLGGTLKQREMLSGRLGDAFSMLYLVSAVLKRYEDEGRPAEDMPFVDWSCRQLLYRLQEALHGVLLNIPARVAARLLRLLVFPMGRNFVPPSDALCRRVAALVTAPTASRARLVAGAYLARRRDNPVGMLDEALELATAAEPLESRHREALKSRRIDALDLEGQLAQAIAAGILNEAEADQLRRLDEKVMALIRVDDFDPSEIGRRVRRPRSQRAAGVDDETLV